MIMCKKKIFLFFILPLKKIAFNKSEFFNDRELKNNLDTTQCFKSMFIHIGVLFSINYASVLWSEY